MRLFKVVQKRLYDILSSKQSLLFCFLGLILMSISALHFGETLIEWSHTQYQSVFNSYRDNILEKNLQGKLCQYLPIDVVYTWVNGSDPRLLSELYVEKQNFIEENHLTRNVTPSFCMKHLCISSQFAVMHPVLSTSESYEIKLMDLKPLNVLDFLEIRNSKQNNKLFLLRFENPQLAKQATLKGIFSFESNIFAISEAFLSNEESSEGSLLLNEVYLISGVNGIIDEEIIRAQLQFPVDKVFTYESRGVAVITVLSSEKNVNWTTLSIQLNDKLYSLSPAFLLTSSFMENEDVSVNRFADNEELRYSLRSLSKYAPWVRKVFIVTNGQIPYWLNLDNPRISIVTHEEIFPNKSDLPSFSSPAIESHIHRIQGVSNKFIYLNDDVFFGKTVWPEDFYTDVKGHKVYLSWPIPDCADGCPTSWIKDGYCDHTCNNSNCEWDGGDCTGDKVKFSYPQLAINKQQDSQLVMENINKMYCSPSCTNSWLGDRYCDYACNVLSCAYDAGDCGVSNFNNIYQFHLSPELTSYKLPAGVSVAYCNLSQFMEDFGTINSGVFEDVPGVRAIAISQKYKVLSFVLQSNFPSFTITLLIKSPQKELKFSVIAETKLAESKSSILGENVTSPESFEIISVSPERRHPKIIPVSLNFDIHDWNISDINITFNSSINILNHNLSQLEFYRKSGFLTDLGFKVRKSELLKYHLYSQTENLSKNDFTMKKLHSLKSLRRSNLFVERGFLPWEKLKTFLNIENDLSARIREEKYELNTYSTRRLKDTFGDSLRHVNKLYNGFFGYEPRKVPAHIAHFIDVDIINRLHEAFDEEFKKTSSHKIRSPTDMQFAFSYYYFLMSENQNVTIDEIFDEFDTDSSDTWSDREIRTLLTRINDLPLIFSTVTDFESLIINCSKSESDVSFKSDNHERYMDSDLPTVTRRLINNCEPIVSKLLKHFGAEKRNKFEILGEDEVAFKMLQSNLSLVLPHLDALRKKPKKFVCLNDNIGHAGENSKMIQAVLKDFYESFFPFPSPFELPLEYRNRFLYVDELKKWQYHKEILRNFTFLIASALIVTSAIICCGSILCSKKSSFHSATRSSFLFDNNYTNV